MTSYLRFLIAVEVAAAGVLLAAAIAFFPLRSEIAGLPGLMFWMAVTLVASALPIRLPAGSTVSVGLAPVLATMFLGGPAAAGLVAAFGTFDTRELRREIPWYGTISNHAQIAIPAIVCGMLYEFLLSTLAPSQDLAGLASFAVTCAVGPLYIVLNSFLAAEVVSARSGQSLATIWSQDLRIIAPNEAALVPLGWLMAQIFTLPNAIGWWATLLFVVPLFTTRMAYHRYVETRELFEQTIGALANAVDARDRYTRGHSQRVSHISEEMCRVMRLPEPEIEKIKWAGLLHDIGKIGIRDNVLLKPGPLDRAERILMNQHPTIGAEIVAPAQQLTPEAPLILYHHEWFNGSGYPAGKEALDIPVGARILTIADAYEAMTSSRPYRLTPLTHEQAVGELEKFSGIQFDPEIVPVLVGLDRSILDRRPDRPDELPTMWHADDPRDQPGEGEEPGTIAASRPAESPRQITGSSAAMTNDGGTARPASPPSAQKGNPPRQALASDDVP